MERTGIGQTVAPFTAAATGGETVNSAALRGRWLLLYFYPKDATPGCTSEGRDFRELHGEFLAAGAVLYGVSRDSLASHEKFRAKEGFPFALISDPDETLCRLFDVIRPKKLYGKDVIGIERSSFLIDPDGVLRREWRKLRVEGHARAVLAALREELAATG